MKTYWLVECPNCGKQVWTNADSVYQKAMSIIKCGNCGRKYSPKLNIKEEKRGN